METLRWFQLLSPWMKSYGVTIQMKPRQHYFHRIKLIFKTDSAQRSSNKWKKYLLNTHSTATFSMLFETSHFNSLLKVTLRLNSQAFSRKLRSNLVNIC